MIENVSSPTLLMRDVMRVVRDVVVEAAFAVPATADTPLIPVTSNAVMIKTDSFLRFIMVFFIEGVTMLKYMECSTQQYFRDSILSRLEIFETRDSRVSICHRMIPLGGAKE